MMDYYSKRKEAYLYVKSLTDKFPKVKKFYLLEVLMGKYGFDEKMLDRLLKPLISQNLLIEKTLEDGTVVYEKVKNDEVA